MQCSAMNGSAGQCMAVNFSAGQCMAGGSAVECIAVQDRAGQYRAVQGSTLQYSTVQCNVLYCSTLHYTALYCYNKYSMLIIQRIQMITFEICRVVVMTLDCTLVHCGGQYRYDILLTAIHCVCFLLSLSTQVTFQPVSSPTSITLCYH